MADKISSRQHQILKLLLENRSGLTIDEISTALDISRNAVTQHFSSLEKKGYLQSCALNKTAGRPACIYTLTDAGLNYFPKQYAWFAELILTDLKQSMGSEAFVAYLQKLAGNLSEGLLSQFVDKGLAERLSGLLSIMDELGFQVKLTHNQENQQAVIEASNCVYHDLAQKYEDVCEFDKTLISSLLGTKIEQVSCMAKGDCVCAFTLKNQS